jgi:hypothetical protein
LYGAFDRVYAGLNEGDEVTEIGDKLANGDDTGQLDELGYCTGDVEGVRARLLPFREYVIVP